MQHIHDLRYQQWIVCHEHLPIPLTLVLSFCQCLSKMRLTYKPGHGHIITPRSYHKHTHTDSQPTYGSPVPGDSTLSIPVCMHVTAHSTTSYIWYTTTCIHHRCVSAHCVQHTEPQRVHVLHQALSAPPGDNITIHLVNATTPPLSWSTPPLPLSSSGSRWKESFGQIYHILTAVKL